MPHPVDAAKAAKLVEHADELTPTRRESRWNDGVHA
jgi:hypothetical protein